MSDMKITSDTPTDLWLNFNGNKLEFDRYKDSIGIDVVGDEHAVAFYLTPDEARLIANWLLKAAEDIS